MRFRLTTAAVAALVTCVLSLGAAAGAMAGAGGNGNGGGSQATATGGGSNSTATSGPGNSAQGCDGTHHSDTGHGANQGGPYDNTCDGSPSGNGNGNGQATGKPCAGCVGNADDKNPKGQMPNGSDHNAGYECDRNHGIGRTNPAHTGCRTTTQSPPPPVCTTPGGCGHGNECTTPGGCNPGGGKNPGGGNETPPAQQAVLGTQTSGSTPAPKTAPESTTPTPQQAVLGASENGSTKAPASSTAPASANETHAAPASASGSLPFTGSDVLVVLLAGCLMLLTGFGIQRLLARTH